MSDDVVLARIDAIEARQRLTGQHDPDCEAVQGYCGRPGCLVYHVADPCNCWLAAPVSSVGEPGTNE